MRYSARALAAVIVAFAFSTPASAWTVDLDYSVTMTFSGPIDPATFDITTAAGGIVYEDDFDGSIPDVRDSAGTGSYNTGATRGTMTESGSNVHMDSTMGTVGISPLSGNLRSLNRLRPVNDYGSGITSSNLLDTAVFATASAFSIATSDPRGGYGIRLRDGNPTGNPAIDFAEVRVRTKQSGGTFVSFRQWMGPALTGSNSVIDEVALATPTGATDIILMMIKPFLDDVAGTALDESKAIYAGLAFYDAVADDLVGSVITFGGAAELFHGESWTRMEQFSTQVVPEPSTWLLMGIGLIGLLVASRRRLS